MSEMLYDVAIEAPGQQARVKWGEEPGWLEKYRQLLERAERISLIPKKRTGKLPVVTVRLGEGKRWVLFSRVYGHIYGEQIRFYCLGWQATVRRVNVKSLLWVYPTGDVEAAEEPSFWRELLK